jgi:cytoskeletal protein RodZ
MKRLTGLLTIAWLLAACSPTNTVPSDQPAPVEQEAQEIVEVLPEPTVTPEVVSPTTLTEQPMPTEVLEQAPPTATTEPTTTVEPMDVEPSQEPESPEEEAQVNGLYENTYFRGSTDAPVTLIDFSDFL